MLVLLNAATNQHNSIEAARLRVAFALWPKLRSSAMVPHWGLPQTRAAQIETAWAAKLRRILS
jgi:hypothetical protein